MASKFNLTAELNLRGPSNLKTVVAGIRRELSNVKVDVNVAVAKNAGRNIDNITNRLNTLNASLVQARTSTDQLNASFGQLASIARSIDTINTKSAQSTKQHAESITSTAKAASVASSKVEEFGKQSALAIKRFAAFSFPTVTFFALGRAVQSGIESFIAFDKQMVKLEQITGNTKTQLKSLSGEITRLSTTMGVSSIELAKVAETLAQAGFSARDTTKALEALAKTDLAPSFDNLTQTTEGAIAAMRQFGLEAKDLEKALGSINAVSAAFAVESGDIIAAIQRTGGVFASTSRGVSEGTDALNEFVAVFTSVRATTRESAETIATGLRTIFTRIQRAGTISQLKEYGIQLQDLEGKFVGPYEAVRRLSEGLKSLDPRDVRFSSIIEELGGFRQIGKVLPLIQQFATAQDALKVAQRGQNSLTDAQIKAQNSLANQFAKVREQFLALMRDIGSSTAFQGLATLVIGLSKGLIGLVSAFKPVLPILTVVAGIKAISGIGSFTKGFLGGGKKETKPSLFASAATEDPKEKITREKNEATARAAEALRINTDAINKLTSAVTSLDSTIKSRPASTLKDGGKVLRFNRGGVVPGVGTRDSVPALLTPKERVLTRSQNKTYEKYAYGGIVEDEIKELRKIKGASFIDSAKNKKINNQKVIQDKDIVYSNITRNIIGQKEIQDFYETKDSDSIFEERIKKSASDFRAKKSKNKNFSRSQKDSLFHQGTGSAFEDFILEYLSKKHQDVSFTKTPENYYTDIDGGDDPIEVKFTRQLTDKNDLLSKITRHYLEQPKQNWAFTPKIDTNPKINVGNLQTYEIDPKYKELMRLADGGRVGYIDSDVIKEQLSGSGQESIFEAMSNLGLGKNKKRINAYVAKLIDLAKASRGAEEASVKKLSVLFGSAGSGKSSILTGAVGIPGRSPFTGSKPILTPQDIDDVEEVVIATSTVTPDKIKRFISDADDVFAISATTQAEQDRIIQNRESRDVSGLGLYGRGAGATKNAKIDTVFEEALLLELQQKNKERGKAQNLSIFGRTEGNDFRTKSGTELPSFRREKITIARGSFGPFTAGHEMLQQFAQDQYGIPPESFAYLVAPDEGIAIGQEITDHDIRTAILSQATREAVVRLTSEQGKGYNVRGTAKGDRSIPQGIETTKAGSSQRSVLLPGEGSVNIVSKADASTKKLAKLEKDSAEAGYQLVDIPRYEGISGSQVREAIQTGDLTTLQHALNPTAYAVMKKNLKNIQNRISVTPSLISKNRSTLLGELGPIDERIAELGPDPQNFEEVMKLKDQKRDMIQSYSYSLHQSLRELAEQNPLDYAIDTRLSADELASAQSDIANRSPMKQRSIEEAVLASQPQVLAEAVPSLIVKKRKTSSGRGRQYNTEREPGLEELRNNDGPFAELSQLTVKDPREVQSKIAEWRDFVATTLKDNNLTDYGGFDALSGSTGVSTIAKFVSEKLGKEQQGTTFTLPSGETRFIPKKTKKKDRSETEQAEIDKVVARATLARQALVEKFKEGRRETYDLIKPVDPTDISEYKKQGLLFASAGLNGEPYSPQRLSLGPDTNVLVGGYKLSDTELFSQIEQQTKNTAKAERKAGLTAQAGIALSSLKGGKKLALDFDKTLATGADKDGHDLDAFADRDKVQKSLEGAQLTILGRRLQSFLGRQKSQSAKTELLSRMRVITARPQSTIDLLGGWLAKQGIPIKDIKGVGGSGLSDQEVAEAKAALLDLDSLFIDDNRLNIQTAKDKGFDSMLYGATNQLGSKSQLHRGQDITEGLFFQNSLITAGAKNFAGGISGTSMDFPTGLGQAARLFPGLDPDIPTDAKRTINSPSSLKSNISNFLKSNPSREPVQAFVEGGEVKAKKNRTKKGSTGARNQFAEISDKYIEDFTKWASDIQREYDNDPSLPLTSYNGLRMPPEIAYAYSLFSKQAFETGGAGLSVGKKFVPHTGDMSKDLQKYILEENPNNPGEYGFFEDIIAKFGRSKQERALIRKQRKDALRGSKTNDGRNALGLTGILRATPEMVAGRALKQTMLEQAIQVPKTEQPKSSKLKASDRFITRFNAMAKNSDFSGLDQSELGGYIAHLKSKNPDILGSFESYKGLLEGPAIARAMRGIEQFKRYEAGLGPTIENSSHAKDFGWLVSQALEGAKEFNEGGIAELSNIPIRSATNIENSLGQIGSEDELLKKLIQKKKNKTIGYSYILGEGALESGYFSDINKALGFSGAGGGVQASKRGGYHETTLSNAIQGFGPYLYEILMEQISSMGSKMMPDRRSVSPQALGVWKKFYNRSSIEKYDLPSKFQYLGETDSLGMNDIDVLNTAYSKTPQFINYPDVVNYSNIKTKDNQTLALMEEVFPENSTIFKNNGGVVRFASGGQAVNSVGADIAKEFNLVQGNTTAFNQLENNCLAIAREVASRFGYENNEDKIRGQLDTFQKLRASKSGPFGIKPTPELLAKSKSISRMYNDPTSAASSGNIIVRESDELMKHVSFEHKNKEYNFGAAGKDWPIILRIPLKKKMEELYSGGIAQFATGGQNKSIRARVSTGELFVPDKTVRSIPGGYKTMEKANHADKNGFSGFSTGGITQFKGPGTGTSDSIETNLSPGFVIRAKAAKAMGYSKGGIVGYKRGGATGGQPIDFSVTLNVDSIKHLTFAIQQLVSTTTDLDEIDRLSNLINDIKNGSINASDAITELKTSTENLAKSGDLVAASLGDRLVKVVSKFEKQEQSKQLASIIPNEKLTQERKSYLEFKSNERGQSVKQFQREEAGKVITRAREIASERNAVGTNLELLATSQRDKLSGLNKAVGAGGKTGISAILEDGTTNANFAQANAAVEQFAAQIQRANPEIAYGDAREAAIKMAEALSENKTASEATGSVLTSFGDKLTKVRDDGLDSLDQAANNLGISLRDLGGKAGQAIKEQSFIQSREGKRFGALAELAPGALQKFSQTGLGRGLGAGADFIEGKGGRLSRGFSRLGGFTGIGAGLVAGSETIKGFLPKDVTSDPNVAGAFGAATGAGVGAATGAQLGSFAGPIGTLIGGVGGALIGGIKGFFDAQNQAILTNAFEKLARSTGDLDEAFKKLDAEFTSLNFSKAQGAFGDVLSTQSEIRDIAFGNENQDNVAAGTGVGASIGAITGGIIGSFGGPVGTAIGAAIGGAIGGEIGFLASTKSPEQRQEALNATIQNAGSNIDTTGRLADKQLQNVTSIKELEKAYENAKNGTNELGPIVEQYAVGIAGSKNKITEQIAAQAKERAAIDAYIKKRKESGATDEQIGKELKTNPKGAIKEGLAAIKVNEELRIKQALLVRSTKEVEIASVKLIDIYRRVGAFAQRYSDELGDISTDIAGYIGDLTGNSEIQNTDRRNERVLGNISAFSGEEVKAAAQQVAAISGNTEGAQQLADQAIIAKTLTDKLPALLNTTNDKGEIEKTLRGVFEDQGVGEESIKAILGEIGTVIDNSEASDSKTLFSEIEEKGVIGKVSAAAEAGLKAMGEIAKQYNDTLDTYSKLANQRNQILIKANNFFRQAEQIRLKSELELAQALGKTLSLDQLNKPFETEVKSLTSGLVQGGTLDPEEIFQGISRLAKENKDIERINKENKGLFNEGTQNGQDKQITGAQLSNIDTLGKNKQAIIESTQALEKLANDGSRAANALAKVQAEQARFDKGVDSLFQAFTSNPLELLEMNFNTDALNRVLSGDNSGLKTAEGRRSALAGLEQDKDLLLPEEYRDKRAKLLEANFRATQNGPLTEKQQKVIDRVRTGDVDPNDPNVKAYREAVAVQEAAMDKLGKLQLDAALDVTNAMYTVADKFDDLPLLAKAIAAATNAQDEANNPRDRTLPIPKEEQERRNEAQRDIKAKKAAAKTAADIAESRKKKKDPKTKEFAKNAEVAAKLAKDSEQKELDRIASDDKKRAEQFATKNKEEKQAQIAQQTAKINVATQQQKAIASRRLSPSLTTRQKEIFEGITETTSVSQPKPQPRSQAVTQQEEIKIQEEAKKISTVDPLTLALSKQESQVVTKDLDALNLSRESKLEEIQKAERSAKAARVARAGRGDLNKEQRKTVTPQEEKLSLFQQDLASIDEQIKEKQNRQTELNKTISKANSPIAAVSAVSKSAQVTGTNIPTTQQSNVDSFVAQSNTEFTTDEQGVTRGEGGKVAFIEPQTSTATSNTQQRSSLVTTPNPQTYAQRKETERSSRKASYQSGKKAKRAAYVSSLNPGQRKAFDSKEKEKQSANQRAIDRLSAIPEEKRTVSQKKALEERQSQAVAYNKAQVEKNAPQVAQGYAKAKQIGSAISGFFGGGQTANTQVASGSTIARLKEKTTGVEALRPTLINGERTSAPVNPIATAQATQASGVTTTTVPSTPQEGTYSPADTPKQEGKKASSNLEGNMLIISPDSLQSLQGVFDSFNGYIENLKSWVPPDLKFTGSFKVDIDVKGMTSGLTEDGVKKLITEAITPIETQIKNGMLGPKFKTSGEKGSTKE